MARHGRSFLFRAIIKNPFPALTAGAGANAAGATVTLASSLVAGTATGAASAGAVTVSEATALVSGAATGAASPVAATVTEQVSLATAGAATGAATRAGATVTEQESFVAGAATGAAAASAATVSLATSLIAGTTAGGVSAAGATVTETAALITNGSVLDLVALGKPHAGNTGVQSGVTLTAYSGPNPITTPNTLVENKEVAGTLYVDTTGVVIRNCRFASWDFYGVDASTNGQAVTVEYCDFIGNGLNSAAATLCNGTVRYNDISLAENGIYTVGGNGCVIEYNYVHDLLSSAADPHYCGIQVEGGETNLTIRGNTVIDWLDSGVFLQSLFGPISAALIDANFIKGGSYSLELQAVGQPYTITNVTVTNNILTKGAFDYYAFDVTPLAFTGNVLWDLDAGASYPGFSPATGAASAAGATVSAVASLVAGSASAGGTANASGVTVSLAASLIAGAATGAALAAGGTLAEATALIAGAASGAAAAAAATVTEATSFVAGSAVGGIVASGATVTATTALVAGAATGAGVASGTTVAEAVSFVAGTAVAGSGAPPATVTLTTALIAGTGTGAALAPILQTLDQLDDTWDSTGVTFDDASGSIIGRQSFALVAGAAIVDSTAPGATLTETATLLAGAAIGNTAPVAAGATVTAVTTLIAGAASSAIPAMVTGTTVSVLSSLAAGTATGAAIAPLSITFDQTGSTWDATGATFDNTSAQFIGLPSYTVMPGAVVVAVAVAGVTFETSSAFIASPANVPFQPVTAAGATLTVAVSLEAGTAQGLGWTPLPEGEPTWTNVAEPSDGWTVVPRPGGVWDKAA